MIKILEAEELFITSSELFRGMGYGEAQNESLLPVIEKVIKEIDSHLDVKAGYRVIDQAVQIKDTHIYGESFTFEPGKVINSQLKGSQRISVFTATLGSDFDNWSRSCFNAKDPLKGYIVDTAGSVLVEKAADKLEEKLRTEQAAKGFGCTNRFSPGYCGWNVIQQHELFDLLPEGFCGIELTDSALMLPIKSVSGIIGIGIGLTKKAYQCSICEMKNCYLRLKK